MESHPLDYFAREWAARGIRVVRFEFPYMRARRIEGKRRGPDRPEVLLEAWREVVRELALPLAASGQGGGAKLVIGGKSMGGRMASMIADEVGARGLVCLGYPFHPPGKPQQLRTKHLASLQTPTLIVQGQRDPFGTPAEVAGYALSQCIRVQWIADGDHSFKPRKSSGRTEKQNLNDVVNAVDEFVASLR